MQTDTHILIAEDNEDDVELLRMALKAANIKSPIDIVANGATLIAYLKGEEPFGDRERYPFPRVLLLDIQMPFMNGFEVLNWLRAHPEYCVVPTIVMSSSHIPADIETAYRLGANAYIAKPSTFEDLVECFKIAESFWRLCKLPPLPARCKY